MRRTKNVKKQTGDRIGNKRQNRRREERKDNKITRLEEN
jgi:hypothetical protein